MWIQQDMEPFWTKGEGHESSSSIWATRTMDMIAPPQLIYAIILNWNNYKDTRASILSLLHSEYINLKIILVDNGSIDDSTAKLQQEFTEVDVIYNDRNLGFAAGCNVGIRQALRQIPSAILLINNDAVVAPFSLKEAARSLFSYREVGIVGGKIVFSEDHSRVDSVGVQRVIWPLCMAKSSGTGKIDKGQFDKPREIVAVKGAFMLIKRAVFDSIGVLEEAFFLGGEDLDFCLRARNAGFKVLYEPKCLVYHRGGASHNELSSAYLYCNIFTKGLLMKRFLPPSKCRIYSFIFRAYVRLWRRARVAMKLHRLPVPLSKKIELMRRAKVAMEAALHDIAAKQGLTLSDWERWSSRHD